MAKVAQYITLLDEARRLPTPNDPDLHLRFQVPNIDATSPSILFFRVQAEAENVRLRMRLDPGAVVVDRPFPQDSGPRSMHEIASRGQLQEGNNELVVTATGGTVVVSDIVFLYHTSIQTVAVQP